MQVRPALLLDVAGIAYIYENPSSWEAKSWAWRTSVNLI
jgi:hypothetical protein